MFQFTTANLCLSKHFQNEVIKPVSLLFDHSSYGFLRIICSQQKKKKQKKNGKTHFDWLMQVIRIFTGLELQIENSVTSILDQLAKSTFRSRYAHTSFSSAHFL